MPGTSSIEASKIVISNLLSLSPTSRRLRGKTSPEMTDRGYELRSLGPTTLGPGALDSRGIEEFISFCLIPVIAPYLDGAPPLLFKKIAFAS
jgi:hypothetical protein